jgi:iron complex outermembrane recepter protein
MSLLFRFILCSFFALTATNTLWGQVSGDTLGLTQKPDSIIAIDEVTVSAYQIRSLIRSTPGNISLLTGNGLSISEGTSFATALNTLPGITMQSGTYATNRIVIRGMGSRTPYNTNRIKAYLNEIPITSSDGISTPEDIDMLNLGRIEVVKGPASTLYGSGLGGSLNLYTPTITDNSLSFHSTFGDFNTSKILVNGSKLYSNGGINGSLSHTQSDGYRENSDFSQAALLLSMPWRARGWNVTYTILILRAKAGIPSSLTLSQLESNPQQAAPNWAAIEGYKQYIKGLSGISISKDFSKSFSNSLILFSRLADNYEKRPFNNLRDVSFSGGIRNKLLYKKSNLEVAAGVELIIDSYSWEIKLDNDLLNSNLELRNNLNTFALANYKLNTKLLLTTGLSLNSVRYNLTDLFSQDGDSSGSRGFPTIISPRFGFNYTPTENLAIFGSAGHGFSMPSPEETLLPEGNINPNLKPEQGWQFEFGTRFTTKSKLFELDAALYWIELNNLLVTKRITEDVFTGINAGRTRHKGIEILMNNKILRLTDFPGKFDTRVSLFRSFNRFIEFTDDGMDRSGNILPGIPSFTAQLQLNWEPIRSLSIFINLQQQGLQYLNDDNSIQYSGYFLGNAKMVAPVKIRKLTIITYFGVNNFTNQHYASMVVPNAVGFGGAEPRYYYPGLPRHFFAGLKFKISN